MTDETMEKEVKPLIDKIFETNDYKLLLKKLTPLVQKAQTSTNSCSILKPCVHELAIRGCGLKGKALLLKGLKVQAKDASDTMQQALCFLGFFEVGVINLLDHIIMLLVSNGVTFSIPHNHRIISAQKLEDLDNASLSEKLAFLNENDLNCVSKNINKKLRNSIAHMDFDCYSNGVIKVDGNDCDLNQQILLVSYFIIMVVTAFEKSGLIGLVKRLDEQMQSSVK